MNTLKSLKEERQKLRALINKIHPEFNKYNKPTISETKIIVGYLNDLDLFYGYRKTFSLLK